MFGGPKDNLECEPWDLPCTLQEQYGTSGVQTSPIASSYPYMAGMPKSELTAANIAEMEYIIYLKYSIDLWERGVEGQLTTTTQRQSFHELGSQIMGKEGFNDFY